MSARRQFWLFQCLGWSAFVSALLLPWLGALPLGSMLVAKAPLVGAGVGVTLLLRLLYRELRRRGARAWIVAATVVAASYIAAIAWSGIADWTSRVVLRGAEHASLIRLSFDRFGGTSYCALVLIAWSMLYFGVTQYKSLGVERERSITAESLAREARLEALRYQVNPHFLFNTLNAISTLVVEVRTAEAGRMISQLSDFLRLTLSGDGEAEIALAEEVRFARQYLEIERVRFGDRLAVTIEVAPEVESLRVPALILIPIVENAVRHAVERNERGGEIAIRASLHENALRLSVTDDGPGSAAVPIAGSGIGLSNTRARLHQLFGSQHLLRRSSLENGGSEYLMEIPARHGPQSYAQLAHA